MIELTSVDQNGSGVTCPMLLDPNEITAVIDVSHLDIDVSGVKTILALRSMENPIYSTASYADLREILK